MNSNRFYNMKHLALLTILVLTQGCAQKLGYIPQSGYAGQYTGIARLFTLNEITEQATLMANDSYLFATGAGSGLGFYNFQASRPFTSGASAFPVDPRTPNFLDGNAGNVLSMAQGGSFLYISSNAGLYEISLSQMNYPLVNYTLPYSRPDLFGTYTLSNGTPQFSEAAKQNFRFGSMVYVPSTNEVWTFRAKERSRFSVGGLSQNPNLSRELLGFNTSCNGEFKGSSAYLQGKVYVAACDGMKILKADSTGSVIGTDTRLNPVQVVATRNLLYVHHQPGVASGWGGYSNSNSNFPGGIYVLDANLNQVNYIAIEPISFAISPDNQLLFANEDNADVGAYRIPWTNSGIR